MGLCCVLQSASFRSDIGSERAVHSLTLPASDRYPEHFWSEQWHSSSEHRIHSDSCKNLNTEGSVYAHHHTFLRSVSFCSCYLQIISFGNPSH